MARTVQDLVAEARGRIEEIAPDQLAAQEDCDLIDVREPNEWDIVRVPGAQLLPKAQVPDHLDELATASELLVVCRSGRRSADIVRFLRTVGFSNVKNVTGGVLAWAREIDPSLPTY